VHVFQAWPCFAAALKSFESMRDFVHNTLPKYPQGTIQPLRETTEKEIEAETKNEKAVAVNFAGVEMMMKGGSAEQRSNKPELLFVPRPDLPPEPPKVDNKIFQKGCRETLDVWQGDSWEVEDNWEDDGWLRGDGEPGIELQVRYHSTPTSEDLPATYLGDISVS